MDTFPLKESSSRLLIKFLFIIRGWISPCVSWNSSHLWRSSEVLNLLSAHAHCASLWNRKQPKIYQWFGLWTLGPASSMVRTKLDPKNLKPKRVDLEESPWVSELVVRLCASLAHYKVVVYQHTCLLRVGCSYTNSKPCAHNQWCVINLKPRDPKNLDIEFNEVRS